MMMIRFPYYWTLNNNTDTNVACLIRNQRTNLRLLISNSLTKLRKFQTEQKNRLGRKMISVCTDKQRHTSVQVYQVCMKMSAAVNCSVPSIKSCLPDTVLVSSTMRLIT